MEAAGVAPQRRGSSHRYLPEIKIITFFKSQFKAPFSVRHQEFEVSLLYKETFYETMELGFPYLKQNQTNRTVTFFESVLFKKLGPIKNGEVSSS